MISCQIFKNKIETCITGITSSFFSAHMPKSSPQGEGVRKCDLWERLRNRTGALVNKPFPKRPGRDLSWRLLRKQLLLRTPASAHSEPDDALALGFSVSRGGGNRFLWFISCWVSTFCSVSWELGWLRHWAERLQPWLHKSCPAVPLPASLAPCFSPLSHNTVDKNQHVDLHSSPSIVKLSRVGKGPTRVVSCCPLVNLSRCQTGLVVRIDVTSEISGENKHRGKQRSPVIKTVKLNPLLLLLFLLPLLLFLLLLFKICIAIWF